jgi:hypothetical protein
MNDDYISSADMAEQALSEAVDEHIENSKEVIDHIEALEVKIRSWNMEDIREFKLMITEMRALLQKYFQVQIENFMNMNSIPTRKVPDFLKQAYKIICVDKRGYALYGHEMEKIAHIKKISEHYQQSQAAHQKPAKAEK